MKDRASDPKWQEAEYKRLMGEEALQRQKDAAAEEKARERERKKLERYQRG